MFAMESSQTDNSMNQTSSQQSRITAIDLIRTVSIVAVIALHCRNSANHGCLHVAPTFFLEALTAVAKNGRYGVTMFFVISGFVISRMISKRYGNLYAIDVRDFYIRRIARIWPLLIITAVIGLAVTISLANTHITVESAIYQIFSPSPQIYDRWFFLSFITATFNWLILSRIGEYGLHWVILWSIAVEEQFYLLFPLLLRRFNSNKKIVPLLLLLVIIGPVARWLGTLIDGHRANLESSFAAYDLLAMGVLLFMFHRRWIARLKAVKWLSSALCGLGFCLMVLTYFWTDFGNMLHIMLGPSLLGISVCLFMLGALALPAFQAVPSIFTLPGQLSYGMYIYHPLCMLAGACILPRADVTQLFAMAAGLSTVLSIASFYLFEQPSNRLICKTFTKSTGSIQSFAVPEAKNAVLAQYAAQANSESAIYDANAASEIVSK